MPGRKKPKKNPATGLSEATAMQAMMELKEQGWANVHLNGSIVSFTGWTKIKPHRKARITAVFTQPRLNSDSIRLRLMYAIGDDKARELGVWTLARAQTAVQMPSTQASKLLTERKPATKKSKPKKRPGLLAGFFSNPTDMEKAWAIVSRVFREERARMEEGFPTLHYTGLRPNYRVHDSERHFAMTGRKRDGVWVEVAPVLGTLPISKVRGVIRHELGHAAILHGYQPMVKGRTAKLDEYDRREAQADRVAEKLSGAKIFYDEKNIEVSGPGARGTRPRPPGVR